MKNNSIKLKIKKFIKSVLSFKLLLCAFRFAFCALSAASRQKGAAAIITVISVLAASLIFINFFAFSFANSYKIIANKINSQKIFYASEAGLEDNIYRIKNQMNYTASNTLPVGSGQSNITITTSGNTKTILSEGAVGQLIRRLQSVVTITTSEVAFHYGVQTGQGGLEMEQNAEIIGNVYSNGNISGASGVKISGDAIVATSAVESVQARSTVCNSDQPFGKTNPIIDMAQSFTAPTSKPLAKISIYIKKSGNPGDRTIKITADSGGSPATTALASATLSASLVTMDYGWIDAVFSPPISLTSGNTYWIIFDADQNNSKYWYWCSDSNQGYGNGVGKYKQDWDGGGSWTQIADDLNFKTYFGSGINYLNNIIVSGNAKSNTITNSKICGDAYYQTIDSSSLNFLNNPTNPTCPNPLTNGTAYSGSADSAIQSMPISDGNIAQWKADALSGGTYSDAAHCTPANNTILGPAKLACDLTISNNKIITIAGPIWVEGNILLDNNSKLILDSSFGNTSTVIIADYPGDITLKGTIRTTNGVAVCGSAGYNSGTGQCNSSSGSYIMLLSTYSGTGKAIQIENNVEGAIFYAAYGSAKIENNASVKEIIAYKLELENNVTIIYESGLANAQFSSGPGASWQINNWKEVE